MKFIFSILSLFWIGCSSTRSISLAELEDVTIEAPKLRVVEKTSISHFGKHLRVTGDSVFLDQKAVARSNVKAVQEVYPNHLKTIGLFGIILSGVGFFALTYFWMESIPE